MSIIFNEELICLLFNRVYQYAIIKYGKPADMIIIDNGGFKVRYYDSCCGSHDYEDYDVSASDLTEDLDKIALERKKKEEEERIKREEENKKWREQQYERREREDKELFLKLKKRFEP